MSATLGNAPRVLIVRLGAIGDVVNALIVANAVRREIPGARIGWATHPLSASMVQGHPSVDRVHVWHRGGAPGGLRRLIAEVRNERYDVAVDLQRLQKSSLLARLSGAQRVLGFDRRRSKELSWLWTKERIASGPRREHMVEQYQRFLPLLGISGAPLDRTLVSSKPAAHWASDLVEQRCGGRAPILLNLGASKEDKRWPEPSFLELAQSLNETFPDRPIALTGGPGDAAAGNRLKMGAPGLIQLAGETTLPELIALTALSLGMVTGDTGAMHIAAALGVPTGAIFGPRDPIRTGPYGEGHLVLTNNERLKSEDPGALERPRERFPMSATTPGTVLQCASDAFRPDRT
ncbi:MAG: glycosyltransferase family 9 protein [Planctomycetota bacterium]